MRAPDNTSFSTDDGFTLIELLIGIAVASILIAIAGGIFYSLNKGMSGENTRVALQQGVRTAVDVMAAEIMEAGLDPHSTKRFRIEKAASNEIRFLSDRNMDGDVDSDNGEIIDYKIQGSNLMALTGANSFQSLLSNVEMPIDDSRTPPASGAPYRKPMFVYRDKDGQSLIASGADEVAYSDLDKIRSVEITLSLTEKYWAASSSETRAYRTLVKCRNLNRL